MYFYIHFLPNGVCFDFRSISALLMEFCIQFTVYAQIILSSEMCKDFTLTQIGASLHIIINLALHKNVSIYKVLASVVLFADV